MDPKIKFLFYAGAVICFVLAAAGDLPRRRGAVARIGLLPLGLALFVFPTMWDTGEAAF